MADDWLWAVASITIFFILFISVNLFIFFYFSVFLRGKWAFPLVVLSLIFFVGSGGGEVPWSLTLVATSEATCRLVAHFMEFGAGIHMQCVLARVGVVPAVAPPLLKKMWGETTKKVELMSRKEYPEKAKKKKEIKNKQEKEKRPQVVFPPSKGLSVLVGSAHLSNGCGLSGHVHGEL